MRSGAPSREMCATPFGRLVAMLLAPPLRPIVPVALESGAAPIWRKLEFLSGERRCRRNGHVPLPEAARRGRAASRASSLLELVARVRPLLWRAACGFPSSSV